MKKLFTSIDPSRQLRQMLSMCRYNYCCQTTQALSTNCRYRMSTSTHSQMAHTVIGHVDSNMSHVWYS